MPGTVLDVKYHGVIVRKIIKYFDIHIVPNFEILDNIVVQNEMFCNAKKFEL